MMILNSSNLVFATAMVVSTTAVVLAFLRQNRADISPAPSEGPTSRKAKVQILRPCLSSGGKKERKTKKVKFAENVKKKGTEGKIMNNVEKEFNKKMRCRSTFPGIQMPENRVALYNGILRDRSQRMRFSH